MGIRNRTGRMEERAAGANAGLEGKADLNKLGLATNGQQPVQSTQPLPGQGRRTQPAPVSSLPQGSKQIGTSGGKPVYQTPDGRKFLGN